MVKLNKIYTRTGDAGTTGLAAGPRRRKDDLRIDCFGTVDEANACVGMARVHLRGVAAGVLPVIDGMLERIQNDLFDLGADLATPDDGKKPEWEPLRIVQSQVDRLERDIDTLNADIPPLKSFILPGGAPAAAALHLARTVARRAERLMVELAARETVSPEALKFVNRLSDFLFVAARAVNDNGAGDVLWVPGANR
ncbi:MAG: cob(I)yrinic acid a,c-diamide adenosyltransferase [Rhizobiaceae bacterium]|nr:cob(I)yrinic acid a,c-diamide adenosyltransferase [Rhizobiaceae bacterium]